jgi:putative oxidoreductase
MPTRLEARSDVCLSVVLASVLQPHGAEVLDMTSLALFVLRSVVGALLAGHGAQKLFGWSGGGGLEGTAKVMRMLGLRPEEQWAFMAGASEFVGGVLTFLGLLNPVGPILGLGAMATATLTAHKDKPIWATKGGPELPVTNMAVLVALLLAGPGRLSLDAMFGTKVPWWFSSLALVGAGAGVAMATAPGPVALPAPRAEPKISRGDEVHDEAHDEVEIAGSA